MTLLQTRGVPSQRALKLKERLLSSPYEIDIERARYYTRVWKRMEDAPPCMRAACALRETLQNMRIRIDEDELLVGVKTYKRLAGVIPVERGEFNSVLEMELDQLLSRERRRFHITDEERRELEEEILPYWKDKTARAKKIELWKREGLYETPLLGPVSLYRIVRAMGLGNAAKIASLTMGGGIRNLPKVPRKLRELAGIRPNLALTVFDVQGHLVPGHKRVLEMGFEGIADLAARELEKLQPGTDDYEHRRDFLEATQVAARAVCDYALRYADLAERMAAATNGKRGEELRQIAERCRQVPAKPPRNFMEALQSLWMTQVVLCISYGMAEILSPGRVDQYLYPYYQQDLDAGRITRESALEAIEEYYVKLGTFLIMLVEIGKDTASEMGVGSNTVTIGGLDRQGNDATNEVSHLFLEAHENLRALANNLCIRISSKTPREFLKKACESHRYTSGHAFFNDEVIVKELVEDGYSLEDARDYSIVGCVEPTSTGNSFACTAGNDISLAGVLEMALNEGRMLFSGRRVGAKTPDPRKFTSFEDVKRAFAEQLSFNVKKLVRAIELKDQSYAESFPSPLISSTLEGCLESGKDMTRGGARYNYGSITGRGLGTVANSLAAIRWAVFEEKIVTMEELIQALRNNFRGREALRQKLLRMAPKYGNDDDRVDELAAWVSRLFCDEVRKNACGRGGFYRPGIFSYGVHVVDGLFLGATPDGRLAGEPVSNGISPANATEYNGPTAVLRSAALSTCAPLSDGTALNLRLSPTLLESDEGVEKLSFLIDGYFVLGGRHVQFNVVDTATLKDAQAHPEKYPDLVVRVSGYCAYFTDLGKSIQDEIIARTEFSNL
ncbi:MAG: pyruvate formate lyase family protein [Actinomycetota bacterium]|nr:pyruvate formate lyase family protein [Actinomycetota bacterium]